MGRSQVHRFCLLVIELHSLLVIELTQPAYH